MKTKIQEFLMNIAAKMNENKYIKAMRDGFMLGLPFLMIGAILTAIVNMPFMSGFVPEHVLSAISEFVAPSAAYTSYIYSLFVVVGIAYNLAKINKVHPLNCSFMALVCMLITIPPVAFTEAGEAVYDVLPFYSVGASAILTAILCAFIFTELYCWLVKHNLTIKLPNSVPASISDSFTSFIPDLICILFALTICWAFKFTSFGTLNDFVFTILQMPLFSLGNSLPATIMAGVLVSAFWFLGLNGHALIYSVFWASWGPAAVENIAALASGQPLPNLINDGFASVWMMYGGWISIPLLIALWFYRKKRKDWGEIMKISLIPGLFNIVEPIMFGFPLVLNPYTLIPLLLTPIISCSVGYFCHAIGLIPYCIGIGFPLTTPLGLVAILETGSILAGAIQVVVIAILVTIWYVFLKIQDNAERTSGIYVENE